MKLHGNAALSWNGRRVWLRSALLASIYVVSYLALSVPAIIAGVAATSYGLRDTTYGYGVVVIVLAALTTIAVSRRSTAPARAAR